MKLEIIKLLLFLKQKEMFTKQTTILKLKVIIKVRKIILFLVLVLFLISCEEQIKEKPVDIIDIKDTECAYDSDCATGGCSGQICGEKEKVKEIVTTCEYKQEYDCLRLTSCGCIDNKCQWEDNNDYKKCINNLKIK